MTKWGFWWRSSILKQERAYSGGTSRLLGDYIEKWGNEEFYTKQDLLAKGFLLPTLSTSILFVCFWIDLARVLATTGNTSAVAGYTRVSITKVQGPRFQRNYTIARDQKSDLHGTSFQSLPKLTARSSQDSICIQWKFTTPNQRSFVN